MSKINAFSEGGLVMNHIELIMVPMYLDTGDYVDSRLKYDYEQ